MTESPTREELVTMTREEFESRLAEHVGFADATASSTRERSPIKPQDHQPAAEDLVKVEHNGVTYEVRKKALGNLRLLDLMEHNQLASALRLLVGDAKFEEFLESADDGTGFVDVEEAGPLLQAISEKAGAKN